MEHLTSPHITSQAQHSRAQHSRAQHSTAEHSTAQHSTAQHSTAQHRAQHSTSCVCPWPVLHLSHSNLPLHTLSPVVPTHFQQTLYHLPSPFLVPTPSTPDQHFPALPPPPPKHLSTPPHPAATQSCAPPAPASALLWWPRPIRCRPTLAACCRKRLTWRQSGGRHQPLLGVAALEELPASERDGREKEGQR
jgi:hypothetical protein